MLGTSDVLDLGVQGVLPKPFANDELLEAVVMPAHPFRISKAPMHHTVRSLFSALQCRIAHQSLRPSGGSARKRVLLAARHRAIAWPLLTLGLLLAATVWMWRGAAAETHQIARERFGFKVAEARFAIDGLGHGASFTLELPAPADGARDAAVGPAAALASN